MLFTSQSPAPARRCQELIACENLDDFGVPAHKLIFEAMCRVQPPLECATIAGELDRHAKLESSGGWAYLTELDYGVVPERLMRARLTQLRKLARLRRLVRLGEELVTQPYEPGANPMLIAQTFVSELSSWSVTK